MKIGLNTECLGYMSFDNLLKTCVQLGIQTIEPGCGNWSKAPHVELDRLLESKRERDNYLLKIKDNGLSIAALNCSGNQLCPNQGKAHDEVVRKTFKLAEMFGVDRIVMTSGLPGGPGDRNPNWIVTHWPLEVFDILKYQWEEVAIPYWRNLVRVAVDCGIKKIAVEPHGWQLVYNIETIMRLRTEIGQHSNLIGLNMDPSHPLWMGGDPIQMIRDAGDLIYYVHIKDVRFNNDTCKLNTVLDSKPGENIRDRSWNFVIPGSGNDELWWTTFVNELKLSGYNDVLSIEMEDHSDNPAENLAKAVEFMKRII